MAMRRTLGIAGALLALTGGWVTASGADAAGAGSGIHSAKKTVLVKEANNKYGYVPAKATVKVDTTVTWTNKTDVAHNVTFQYGSKKVNQDFKVGKSTSFHFTKAGMYSYHCEYHPYMHGTITVTK